MNRTVGARGGAAPVLIVVVALIALVIVITLVTSVVIVDGSEVGVVIYLGQYEPKVLREGAHVLWPPLVRRATKVNIRERRIGVELIPGDSAASADLQDIYGKLVLNYRVVPDEAWLLLKEVGPAYEDVKIVPILKDTFKNTTAKYKADVVPKERPTIRAQTMEALRERLDGYHLEIIDLAIENISYTSEYARAVEEKQIEEQAALKKEYELQKATKDIEIKVAQAEGDKKAAITRAEGEAESIQLKAEALQENPILIQYEWATRLAPSVRTILLPGDQSIILDSSIVGSGAIEGSETVSPTTR